MGGRCYFGGRASDYVRVFGIWCCGQVRTVVAGLSFPYHGWLKQPFQEDIRWDRVALSADAGEDIRRLIVFLDNMVEFEPLEPS